jgi:glycosyltransferase involved in cell wall biosynthesis
MSLSVLMSIYHKEKVEYLEQCFISIYDEQTIKPDEIVLVKDGKLTKELDDTIEKWQEKLKDILKTVPLENNVGLAKALNEGIEHCTCEYIARMDTDDISLPNRFKQQLSFFELNDIDMCSGNAILIDNNSNIVGKKSISNEVSHQSLLKNCDVIHPASMFKKDFFIKYGKYNPEFKKSQDYELWLRASKNGAKIKNIDEALIKFRISDDLIIRRKNEQKYNMMIKKEYLSGLKYYMAILPNILILVLPVFVLDILLKIKNKAKDE